MWQERKLVLLGFADNARLNAYCQEVKNPGPSKEPAVAPHRHCSWFMQGGHFTSTCQWNKITWIDSVSTWDSDRYGGRLMERNWMGVVLVIASCHLVGGQETGIKPPLRKLPTLHLPNAYRFHPKVISGGEPAGEAAFEELRSLGVKTIISVDGAKPDVQLAKRFGLRYVHLPHGYDGIPEERIAQLAKAVRDLPGPIYIHCHHGKHRSPAAATVACVSVGYLNSVDARNALRVAGTSESYRGLYQSAESARRIDERVLDELSVQFRETVPLPPLAEAMVAIEHIHDQVQSIAKTGWKPRLDRRDLDPAHEALLLREQFVELSRSDEVRQQPKRFQEWVDDSEAAAKELETALREAAAETRVTVIRADRALDRITNNCTACHRQFRDQPLSEKTSRR